MRHLGILILLCALALPLRAHGSWMDSSMGLLQGELTARYGPGQRPRIQRGLAQVARFWQPGDGGAGEFEAFVRAQFAGEPRALDRLFGRVDGLMANLDAHLLDLGRACRSGRDLPVDALLASWDPGAHLDEDFFADKLAFAVLLNFPLTSLEERVRDGPGWSGRQWAEAWLAERFGRRVPPRVHQAEAAAAAERRRAMADPGAAPRCQVLLQTFQAARALDPCCPLAPTRIARSFNQERQLPEDRARRMLEAVCGSPLAPRAAGLIRARLGRALAPPDLDYRFCPDAGRSDPAPGPAIPVPSAAFADALARLSRPGSPEAVLDAFWSTYRLAGAALVDMDVWHWLYEHPDCTAADLEPAVAACAGAVWDRYFAPVLGRPGCARLAADPRLLAGSLDLPDAAISGMIAVQLLGSPGDLAGNLRNWERLGRITPDLWMVRATGSPLGPGALLEAAAAALRERGRQGRPNSEKGH